MFFTGKTGALGDMVVGFWDISGPAQSDAAVLKSQPFPRHV